eukprot:TRINITY_DN3884_c0_g1_i2.p1 TRINITY_DN3884_c0_g1~~TRINITY_DN3884_c0_g1_i2.p1  ORF type:complete len:116 (+),score=16.47 TRINITY_DN3884_c0_g1_i2:102-449(+)
MAHLTWQPLLLVLISQIFAIFESSGRGLPACHQSNEQQQQVSALAAIFQLAWKEIIETAGKAVRCLMPISMVPCGHVHLLGHSQSLKIPSPNLQSQWYLSSRLVLPTYRLAEQEY